MAKGDGGSLASVHSEEQMSKILSNINDTSWIGLFRTYNSSFEWVDNSNLDFVKWENGEPNGYNWREFCVEMYANNGKWNDMICPFESGYICQIPKGKFFCALTM